MKRLNIASQLGQKMAEVSAKPCHTLIKALLFWPFVCNLTIIHVLKMGHLRAPEVCPNAAKILETDGFCGNSAANPFPVDPAVAHA